MVKREEEALTRLKNYEHFPKLLSTGDNFIDISYCGTFQKGLDNNQCFEILKSLKEAKIIHRDVIPKNLLTKNGIVYLIDFGWCIFDDEQDTPVPSPHQLGGPYYNRVWNDENAMKICLRESNL
jgi:serine/threonine protein kinase